MYILYREQDRDEDQDRHHRQIKCVYIVSVRMVNNKLCERNCNDYG